MRSSAGHLTRRTGLILGGLAAGMLGLAFAAVPLYDIFCRVTGFGGATDIAQSAPGPVESELITVRFDAGLARGMPWVFRPVQREMHLHLGEQGLAFYRAHNPTDRTVTGVASYNVAPHRAGKHFSKIECFCFREQTLAPGQSIDMPVTFFVEPGIRDDPEASDVQTITLSYTFFESLE